MYSIVYEIKLGPHTNLLTFSFCTHATPNFIFSCILNGHSPSFVESFAFVSPYISYFQQIYYLMCKYAWLCMYRL